MGGTVSKSGKVPAAEAEDQLVGATEISPTERSIPPTPSDLGPEFRSLLPYYLRGVSFENERQLGLGSYSIVKELKLNGKKFAAKQLHAIIFETATAQQKTDMLARFANECKLLQSLKHPNIVEFIGVHLNKGSQLPLLVMELLDATWSSYLKTHGVPDTATYHNVLCDVANGLQFLHQHSPPIIHRDLSANNVLLSSTRQAKISDLGVAKVLNFTPNQHSRMTKAPGTPAYMPPEALADAPKYTTSIDIFSFGVLMLHTLCGEWPMPDPATKVDHKNPDRIVAVTEFERRKRFIDKIDHKHSLMTQIEPCLRNNPKSRPDVTNLLETLVTHNQESYVMVGEYDYSGDKNFDLSFKRGERFYIISMECSDWWLAQSLKTGKVGFIPSNYAAKWNGLESEAWYHGGIGRQEAEIKLLQSYSSTGTYLIRCNNGRFTLSVRNETTVKHYRILSPNNKGFFLTQQVQFRSLSDLVAFYSEHAEGICSALLKPCKKKFRHNPHAALTGVEISRQSVRLISRIRVHIEKVKCEIFEGMLNGVTPVAIRTSAGVDVKSFLQEAAIMKKLCHAKLIQLYAVCTKEEPIYIITELMKRGSMLDYLQGDGRTLRLPQLIDMAAQVAAGMAYLEQHNYIHCDVAARSIFVDEGNICKVGDFGLTQHIGPNHKGEYNPPKGSLFPIRWLAPESNKYNRFTIKSDVWSFGILLTEIVTHGCIPYRGMTNRDILIQVEQGYRMPCPPDCPSRLYAIMTDCWKSEPKSRPTFDALQSQFEEFVSDNNY